MIALYSFAPMRRLIDLLLALLGRKPPARPGAHQRNRHRPRLVTDIERAAVRARILKIAERLHARQHFRATRRIGRLVGSDHQASVLFAEDGQHRRVVVRFERSHQRVHRLLGRGKGPLLRSHARQRQRQHQQQRHPARRINHVETFHGRCHLVVCVCAIHLRLLTTAATATTAAASATTATSATTRASAAATARAAGRHRAATRRAARAVHLSLAPGAIAAERVAAATTTATTVVVARRCAGRIAGCRGASRAAAAAAEVRLRPRRTLSAAGAASAPPP